jgi:hypothetical protein
MKSSDDVHLLRDPFLRLVFSEMPCGAAMQKIILDDAGNPVDYVTLEVNRLFEAYLHVSSKSVVGELASNHLAQDELRHWLSIFGPVATKGQSSVYTMYSSANGKTFKGVAVCPEPGFFFVMFSPLENDAGLSQSFSDLSDRPNSRDADAARRPAKKAL